MTLWHGLNVGRHSTSKCLEDQLHFPPPDLSSLGWVGIKPRSTFLLNNIEDNHLFLRDNDGAMHACMSSHFSHVQLFGTPWTIARQALLPWDSPGKNTGVSSHDLLQGIFMNQGLNPGL